MSATFLLESGRRVVSLFLVFSLAFSPALSYAQGAFVSTLPDPGKMVGVSPVFTPVLVKGLVVHPDKPLNFDFIVDSGNDSAEQAVVQAQSEKIVRYFLAALTVPEEQLWVNLSPYEKDRIIDDGLGQTVLGRDMLAQDYVLKQLTASLIYPEDNLGKDFWGRIYKEAQDKFGTTEIPVDTFNKVWIVPQKAEVFEKGNAVYVTQARLKVMLDSDYLAMSNNLTPTAADGSVGADFMSARDEVSRQLIREIILPAIEKEVNEGKNFAALRQIYHAAILAKWYRELIQDTLMSRAYVGQNKIEGVNSDDKTIKEQIYQRYIAAYKQGVFNYIKDETDTATGETTPRKYFSGGISDFAMRNIRIERVSSIGRNLFLGVGFLVALALTSPSYGQGVPNTQQKAVSGIVAKPPSLEQKRKEMVQVVDNIQKEGNPIIDIDNVARQYGVDIKPIVKQKLNANFVLPKRLFPWSSLDERKFVSELIMHGYLDKEGRVQEKLLQVKYGNDLIIDGFNDDDKGMFLINVISGTLSLNRGRLFGLFLKFATHEDLPFILSYMEKYYSIHRMNFMNEPAEEALDNFFEKRIAKQRELVFPELRKIFDMYSTIIPKSRFLQIDSIAGTYLDPNIRDGIWEDVAPDMVRLNKKKVIKEEDVRQVAKSDFDKIWPIIRTAQGNNVDIARLILTNISHLKDKKSIDFVLNVMLTGNKDYFINDRYSLVQPSDISWVFFINDRELVSKAIDFSLWNIRRDPESTDNFYNVVLSNMNQLTFEKMKGFVPKSQDRQLLDLMYYTNPINSPAGGYVTDHGLKSEVTSGSLKRAVQVVLRSNTAINKLRAIDDWNIDQIKRDLPIICFYENSSTYAGWSEEHIVRVLRFAEVARNSKKVRSMIAQGSLQLFDTVDAVFEWSGAPSIPVKVPDVYDEEGRKLNKGSDKAENVKVKGGRENVMLQETPSALSANVPDAAMVNEVVQWVQSNPGWTIAGVVASLAIASRVVRSWWLKNTVAGNIERLSWGANSEAEAYLSAHKEDARATKVLIELSNQRKIEIERQRIEDEKYENVWVEESEDEGHWIGDGNYGWSPGAGHIPAHWEKVRKSDSAMNGGIDIQNIDVNKTGNARIKFNNDALKQVLSGGFDGFTPVFIKMTPLDSPLMVLGVGQATL